MELSKKEKEIISQGLKTKQKFLAKIHESTPKAVNRKKLAAFYFPLTLFFGLN